MHPIQTREQRSTKTEKNIGQREILESRDIRQVPNKRRVEVQGQNRDSLIRDGCTVSCIEGVGSSWRDTGRLLLGRCGHVATHRFLAR